MDSEGNVYFGGTGRVVQPIIRAPNGCEPAVHLTKLSADGSAVLGTKYVGGQFGAGRPRISLSGPQKVSAILPAVHDETYRDTFATTPDAIRTSGPTYIARFDFAANPKPSLACVVNGASFDKGHWNSVDYAIAPLELLTFFGTDLTGAELTIGGHPAPTGYSDSCQINAVAPGSLELGRAAIELSRDGQRLASYEAEVVDSVPGLFTSGSTGQGIAAAWNEDGRENLVIHPAKRGSVVQLYATGFGKMIVMPPDGSITPLEPPWSELTHRVETWIEASARYGVAAMEILYAGPAPGLIAGTIRIDVRIPASAHIGIGVPIRLVLDNEERTQRDITLAVAP